MSPHAAALVLAAIQVIGVGLRIAVGLRSDRVGSRIVPRASRLSSRRRSSSSRQRRVHRSPCSSPCSSSRAESRCRGTALPSSLPPKSPAPTRRAPRSGCSRRCSASSARSPRSRSRPSSRRARGVAFLTAGLFPVLGWALLRPLARTAPAWPRRGAGERRDQPFASCSLIATSVAGPATPSCVRPGRPGTPSRPASCRCRSSRRPRPGRSRAGSRSLAARRRRSRHARAERLPRRHLGDGRAVVVVVASSSTWSSASSSVSSPASSEASSRPAS